MLLNKIGKIRIIFFLYKENKMWEKRSFFKLLFLLKIKYGVSGLISGCWHWCEV